jgi:hypothetical protein
MLKVSFAYSKFQIPPSDPYPQGQTVSRALALATLTAPNGESLRYVVCLDTGADACLFPLELAIALKLDVLALPKTLTGGVGTTSNVTYYAHVKIDLGRGICFPAYAGFTEGLNSQGIGLLGQAGFFSVYDVHFCLKQDQFTIDIPDHSN